jgi:glycerol-3-phosphate dehydrogenase (NAD(P)+)
LRSTVLGAGSWGTALGAVLAGKGFPVVIWDADGEPLETIAARHENARYLPGVPLPETLRSEPDLARALEGAELVVIAVPSHAVRPVVVQARPFLREGVPVCTVAKGVEVDTLMTMSEVLEDVLPMEVHPYLTFLSGPSFAIEVARGAPTAVTVAGRWDRVGKLVQDAFHTRTFRPYTSTDVAGVEIGGCAKNVVAIATGLCDGLGLGANARAALIARGLAEITRLALAKGAVPLTLLGLSGLGDLVLTCSSEKSRNYRVGLGLGTGRKLEEIQRELGQVAEGVVNAKSLHLLSARLGVEMPICEAVYRILEEGEDPRAAVRALLARETRAEGF